MENFKVLLSKKELKLQKKGVDNLSKEELLEWIEICKRNENTIKFNKARRSWSKSRKEAEKNLYRKTNILHKYAKITQLF